MPAAHPFISLRSYAAAPINSQADHQLFQKADDTSNISGKAYQPSISGSITMNQSKPAKPTERNTNNWDLKLAAILFIGTCATMSLVLPNWHASLIQSHGDDDSALRAPVADTGSEIAATPAAIPRPDPAQQGAAMKNYQKGQDLLQKGEYNAAANEFKQALEKSPELADAYVGLGDAFTHLGDYQAAETNARHALAKLKLLRVGQAPDPHLKKELSYAHQVLGIALLHLARGAMDNHDATTGRMQALEAASHCNLAAVFDQSGSTAHDCAKQASALTGTP